MDKIRKLKADEIECRAQIVKKNGCSLLLYKDARCDMKILDETFGAENWQRTHKLINNNLFCRVEIWDDNKEQWITKEDVGVESRSEAEKGQASDSFKRACFNIGIGRELYTAPFIWIQLNADETYKKDNKYRLKSSVNFEVKEIEYTDDKISNLTIIDQKGNVRYKMNEFVGVPSGKLDNSASTDDVDVKEIRRNNLKKLIKGKITKDDVFTEYKEIMTERGHNKIDEPIEKEWDTIMETLKQNLGVE